MHSLYFEAQECPPRRQVAELDPEAEGGNCKAQNHPGAAKGGKRQGAQALMLVIGCSSTKVAGEAVGAESC